ncbi:HNH endonuclease, partial [Amycolatopsis japonica]
MALLEGLTDPEVLAAVNDAADLLDDEDSVALAQAASAGIARLEAVRFRALAQLNRHREGARSVVQEVALELSLV